jgi:hypothetical protein
MRLDLGFVAAYIAPSLTPLVQYCSSIFLTIHIGKGNDGDLSSIAGDKYLIYLHTHCHLLKPLDRSARN